MGLKRTKPVFASQVLHQNNISPGNKINLMTNFTSDLSITKPSRYSKAKIKPELYTSESKEMHSETISKPLAAHRSMDALINDLERGTCTTINGPWKSLKVVLNDFEKVKQR